MDLVVARADFKKVYERVCDPNDSTFREGYQEVLGGFEQKWTVAREKKFVLVLMDLTAAKILPEEKFDLAGFVFPKPSTFIEFSAFGRRRRSLPMSRRRRPCR